MADNNNKYVIRIGCVELEAPTLKGVKALYALIKKEPINYPIDEAVR